MIRALAPVLIVLIIAAAALVATRHKDPDGLTRRDRRRIARERAQLQLQREEQTYLDSLLRGEK